ncbi:hypothetical protein [Streptomyces bikiniensis]|uniref:hypothetical protein n=1 Tax=Streptomyces bikiniensis TaxID=1896 RepID=UPI0004C151A3|nr:hypothetical protein [Streptomyces bikiniensis]
MPPRLRATLTALGTPPDPAALEEVVRAIGGSWAELDRLRRTASTPVDVSGTTEAGLRSHLASQLPCSTGVVKTAWPADGIATRMTAERLVSSIDDLWYPATDDLVVLHEGADGTSVLVLDHEERLTVVRMHGGGHGGAGRGRGPRSP